MVCQKCAPFFRFGLAEYLDDEAIETARARRAQVQEYLKTIPKPSRPKRPSPKHLDEIERRSSELFRSSSNILRPGLPPETNKLDLKFPNRKSPPLRNDDSSGHYKFVVGENLSQRFKILAKLGQGKFGIVLECWDRRMQKYVAIKVVRNRELYKEAALAELEILHTLELNDILSSNHCIPLLHWFTYRNHICLVFDKLGPNLWKMLENTDYQPLKFNRIQHIGKQILEGLAYMHELSLIHTDLKTENILLCNNKENNGNIKGRDDENEDEEEEEEVDEGDDIKIIDFGSAIFSDDYHPDIVTTRDYRAPEVIMDLGWSFPCDIWSVGCIFFELATGFPLFMTQEDLEHLAMMEQVLGPIPEHLVQECGQLRRRFFFRTRLDWPRGPYKETMVANVRKLTKLKWMIKELVDESMKPYTGSFLDLMQGLLTYDPEKRLTANQALKHPFFRINLKNEGKELDININSCT